MDSLCEIATRVPTDLTESGGHFVHLATRTRGCSSSGCDRPVLKVGYGHSGTNTPRLGGRRQRAVARPSHRDEPSQSKCQFSATHSDHFFAIGSNLQATCSDTANVVHSLVRSVGEHVILAEDIAAPSGGLNADEWRTLGRTLDQVVVPVDTSYFGHYEDIDANRRVVVLFTQEVNKLSEGDVGVQGFFLPLDLASSGRNAGQVPSTSVRTCPASNEAEVIYTRVADPEGQVGPGISKSDVIQNTPRLVAHELQHLIQAERRILHSQTRFSEVEDVWLDEALSSLAEEVVGLTVVGFGVRGDYTFDQLTDTRSKIRCFQYLSLQQFSQSQPVHV